MKTPSFCLDNGLIQTNMDSTIHSGSSDPMMEKTKMVNIDTSYHSPNSCNRFESSTTSFDDDSDEVYVVTPPQTPLLLRQSSKVTEIPYHPTSTCITIVDLQEAILLHEDFTKLMSLACTMKKRLYQINQVNDIASSSSLSSPAATSNDSDNVIQMMKESLLSKSFPQSKSMILRGQYQALDEFIDQCTTLLEQKIQSVSESASAHGSETTEKDIEPVAINSREGNPVKKNRNKSQSTTSSSDNNNKEAIVTKYPKYQIDILMNWMIQNNTNPCPDNTQIESLMCSTGLNASQIINWTTNVRKRNLKATCKGNKKPHHFIDFLFLAHQAQAQQETITTVTEHHDDYDLCGQSITTIKDNNNANKADNKNSTEGSFTSPKKECRKTSSKATGGSTSKGPTETIKKRKRIVESHQRNNNIKKKTKKTDSFHSFLEIEKFIFANGDDDYSLHTTLSSSCDDDDIENLQLLSDPIWDLGDVIDNELDVSILDPLMNVEDDEEYELIGNVDDMHFEPIDFDLNEVFLSNTSYKINVQESVTGKYNTESSLIRIEPSSSTKSNRVASNGSSIPKSNSKLKHIMTACPVLTLPSSMASNYNKIDDYDNPIDINEPIDDNVLEDFAVRCHFDHHAYLDDDHHIISTFFDDDNTLRGSLLFDENRYENDYDLVSLDGLDRMISFHDDENMSCWC